jgi:GlcNAc-P-P-Und epimerase
MSRFFITGGSGFIGTNLIQYLIDKEHQVINYDIAPPRNNAHGHLWVQGDILDVNVLSSSVEQYDPEYVVHLAARTDLDGKNLADYRTNTDGVLNIVNTVSQSKIIKRVLFASSRLVCKIGYLPKTDTDYLPTTFYGESKVVGEKIIREYQNNLSCNWVIFRPTSIWGPWFDTPYKEFFFTILKSLYVHPKGMRIDKSFGYVGNTVSQIWDLLFYDSQLSHQKTIYMCDYPPIEVKEWADLIAQQNGSKSPREVSVFILKTLALIGDTLKVLGYKHPPLTSFRLNNLMTNMVYDTQLLQKISPSLPFSTEEGVLETLAWIKKYAK